VSARSAEFSVDLLTRLEDAEDGWNRLAAASGNLFATFEWASAWWRTFGAGASLLLGAARRPNGSLAALLPLVERRERGLRTVRLLGHGPSDRLAPICAPDDRPAATAALRELLAASGADLFVGEQMPAEGGWGAALGAKVVEREASPTIDIADLDWDQFLARRSRNFRQQARRYERRLNERGELRFRLSDQRQALAGDLETVFELHAARWSDGGSSAFTAPRRELHREFARAALERGWLRLWLLELDGRPLAAWYGFRFADAEWFYQSGRDPAAEADRVGFVLLLHTIRSAIEDGVTSYLLLRGDEAYKDRVADGDSRLETIALPLSARGRAALLARRAGPAAGRALRRLRLR
jgi:CelD/BcsL family acetyltransferase involved in cellulose biosynthesis